MINNHTTTAQLVSLDLSIPQEQIVSLLSNTLLKHNVNTNLCIKRQYVSDTTKNSIDILFIGGSLLIGEQDNDEWDEVLTLEKIGKALSTLAKQYPTIFLRIINGYTDSSTGMALLRCALYSCIED